HSIVARITYVERVRRSTRIPAGEESPSGVAKPSGVFQFGALPCMLACPTARYAGAPVFGKVSSEGKITTRLFPLSATKMFPPLSNITSKGRRSAEAPAPAEAPAKLVCPMTMDAGNPVGGAALVLG